MARKNRTQEENARREKIRELLQIANIGSMDDIQSLFNIPNTFTFEMLLEEDGFGPSIVLATWEFPHMQFLQSEVGVGRRTRIPDLRITNYSTGAYVPSG